MVHLFSSILFGFFLAQFVLSTDEHNKKLEFEREIANLKESLRKNEFELSQTKVECEKFKQESENMLKMNKKQNEEEISKLRVELEQKEEKIKAQEIQITDIKKEKNQLNQDFEQIQEQNLFLQNKIKTARENILAFDKEFQNKRKRFEILEKDQSVSTRFETQINLSPKKYTQMKLDFIQKEDELKLKNNEIENLVTFNKIQIKLEEKKKKIEQREYKKKLRNCCLKKLYWDLK